MLFPPALKHVKSPKVIEGKLVFRPVDKQEITAYFKGYLAVKDLGHHLHSNSSLQF